jgi:hypothetical protein
LCNEDKAYGEGLSVDILGLVKIFVIRNKEGNYLLSILARDKNRQQFFNFSRYADDKFGEFSSDKRTAHWFGLGIPSNAIIGETYGKDVNGYNIKGTTGDDYEEVKEWIEVSTGLQIKKFYIGFKRYDRDITPKHGVVNEGNIKTIFELK